MGSQVHRSEDKISDSAYVVDDDMGEEDADSISPISEKPPPWSGTRWARFFPELSSHFSLASPANGATHPLSHPHMKGAPHVDSQLQQPERGNGRSSLSSEEVADNRSSSYTSRSSLTSQGSEVTSPTHNPPDGFHITSPAVAGVFEESDFEQAIPHPLQKRPSIAQSKDKPLPQEPPIELTPLSIRHKTSQTRDWELDHYTRLKPPPRSITQSSYHHSTLSQATNDLERTLAGLTEQRQVPEPLSPRSPLQVLDGPLQISRGNMDMVATRPAPRPPAGARESQQIHRAKSREDTKQTKKPHKTKPPFSFTVPSFGRKLSRAHQRTTSSSSSKSEPESYRASVIHPPVVAELADSEVAELQGSSVIGFGGRPASSGGEKELRMKLPRLQTKEMGTLRRESIRRPFNSTGDQIHKSHEYPEQHRRPLERARSVSLGEKYFVSYSKSGETPANITRQDKQVSEAPETVYELEAGLPLPPAELQGDSTASTCESMGAMPATLPARVVLSILEHVNSLDELFNVAVLRRDFYRVFKQHELRLIRRAVFATSAPAWELREMSPPWDTEWQILLDPDAPVPEYTPSCYLKRYAQDIYTLAHLKSLILARCGTFLRPETIRGLSGMDDTRATEIDDAFWRVWTFCRIFGSGKHREGDIVGQLDWLRGGTMAMDRRVSVATSIADPYDANSVLFEPPAGFGYGNKGALSKEQLHDMTEIWTCLGVLLQPMHGKCSEARAAGVFDGHDVTVNDSAKEEAVLEEWTYYILTLGLSAVLLLGSIHAYDNTTVVFQRAQSMGLTKWEPSDTGASRSTFLREAVSKAYQPRRSVTSQTSLRSPTFNSQLSGSLVSREGSPTTSSPSERMPSPDFHRRRQAAYSAQIKNQRQQQLSPPSGMLAEERPLSQYATIMSRLEARAPAPQPPMPVSRMATSPTIHSNVPNVHYMYASQPAMPDMPVYQPQVRDPVDQALDTLVRELGFEEEKAKWALKVTDNGEGINVNAAISLLIREHKSHEQSHRGFSLRRRKSFLSSVINSPESRYSGWKWA
ncbi:F-box domain protein [Aspergillus sclerotiicarbonarius CBS 121057]|uniref:F-box domain protein n=1 Tax=Aspergillus sclerotiicarbonarius (strain CBS 121057 / IBT 28362) TaxID=1448318 RepID=A0A319EN47_ASPSB|nr:F-box domain protein [Aspergillus sclerotiicarbonarius CBS 121057]